MSEQEVKCIKWQRTREHWNPSKTVWRVFFVCLFLNVKYWFMQQHSISSHAPTGVYIIERPAAQFIEVKTSRRHLHVSLSSLPPSQTQRHFYRRGLIMQRQMEVLKMLQVTVDSITRAAFLSGGLANWTSVSFHNLNSVPLEGVLMGCCCRLCDS